MLALLRVAACQPPRRAVGQSGVAVVRAVTPTQSVTTCDLAGCKIWRKQGIREFILHDLNAEQSWQLTDLIRSDT